jgi:hypothetical protein
MIATHLDANAPDATALIDFVLHPRSVTPPEAEL